MSDQIIELPIADDVWTEEHPRPQPSVRMQTADKTVSVYLCNDTNIAKWPSTAVLHGSWDEYNGLPDKDLGQDSLGRLEDLSGDVKSAFHYINSLMWQGHAQIKRLTQ